VFVVPGFGLVGAIITARSRNVIGPLFLAMAFFGAATALTFEYAVRALATAPASLPFGGYAAALSNAGFPFTWLAFGLTLLLFPDGHLPSRRWRAPASAFVLVWGVGTILSLFVPTLFIGPFQIHNPIGLGGPTSLVDLDRSPHVAVLWNIVSFILLAATASAPILRRRRANAETRQQLRWLALVLEVILALVVVALGFAAPPVHASLAGAIAAVGILLLVALGIPAAIGVAVLKYRLYDLDVVINKTVVYGALALFITVVYVGIVVGVGSLAGSTGNPALSAVAAATVALAFQPARRRAQRLADRLVYGERATPYEVLSEFAGRLSGTFETEDLLPRIARILAEGTGAARADVWLREGAELRAVASWPHEATALQPVPHDQLPEHAVPVLHEGKLLGGLSLEKRPGERMGSAETKLVENLASQAGLVLRNVQLIEDLKASRQRLVAAQDEERRKIERNIHDGAQQQLVALAIQLKLTEQLMDRDADKAKALLGQLQGAAGSALEDLRDLARGIYPPLLADQGLTAALEAQARKAAMPVSVDSDGIGRFSQDVEATVYFCTLEALNNVAKYAEATRATIRLANGAGTLRFEIQDDGAGFDPNATGYGTGLQGMADRLAALGGGLHVTSSPGSGTTIEGHLPLEARS